MQKKKPTGKKVPEYDPAKIEKKWQKKWAASKIYSTKDPSNKKKYYVLDMFPYPSGEGLHVGHPKGYIATDVVSRHKRMSGYSVLHPMGFDAFGLPAENYALKTKTNPADAVKKNVAKFKKQLEILGFDYDWAREVNTTDPKYYKWTQWIFLQLFKKGLAYESFEPINWCPSCKTGLANEDIENGRCERCGTIVEKKPLRQWVLKITDYADRILNDLDAVDTTDSPHIIDKKWPPRPGKKVIERRTIHALVRDPKTNKFLGLKWHKFPWITFIVGGVEPGEDVIQAAKREVEEETGYTDLKFVKLLGGPVRAEYFAAHKDQNRVAITTGVLFELASDARNDVSKYEQEAHESIWMETKDMTPEVMTCAELPVWLDRLPTANIHWNGDVPCFEQAWGPDAVKKELPFAERNAIMAIVKHWKEDKYIGLKWKKVDWKTLITGGPEGEQTLEEAAKEEIIEETGYVNPKLVRKLGNVDAKFFHIPKNLNRYAHFNVFLFELKNGDRQEMTEHDKETHEVVWLSKEEMFHFISPMAQRYAWSQLFLGKRFDHDDETKPLLEWPESIKELQRNWIGRSEGAEISFDIKTGDVSKSIKVFTTRPDTLFGVTYIVLAPENKLVSELIPFASNAPAIHEYIAKALHVSDMDRTDATKDKTGVELQGIKAINPATKEEVPVWIADYVLADYGTGAVMAVPAHDERDAEFAKKYKLPIKYVIAPVVQSRLGETSFKPNEPVINRTDVRVVLKHWSEDKYLVLTWNDLKTRSFISGGVEKDEDLVKAAKREIEEETGYKEAEFVSNIGGPIQAKFYSFGKKQNRIDIQHGMLFALKNDSKIAISEEEQKKHPFNWLTPKELMGIFDPNLVDYHLAQRLFGHTGTAYTGNGVLINSASFDGRDSESEKKEITKFAGGKWVSTYRLRDWVFSRQRYWGEPIPLVHCERHGVVPLPESELPLVLPRVKSYEPTGTGESPLASIEKWVNTKCPQCIDESKQTRHFIFDFDGVLGNSKEACINCKAQVEGISREESLAGMVKYFNNMSHHTRDSVRTAEQIQEDHDWVEKFGGLMAESGIGLFSGFIKEIKKFKKAKFAVVSSGSSQYVKPILKKSGLKFSHIMCFEDHHSKEEKIERICRDWKIEPKQAYYFTDTKGDVYELEKLMGENIIGCGWGYSGASALKEVLPEKRVMLEYADIHTVFNTSCEAKRETNTMPQWAGSCWYYLRYMDPDNSKEAVDFKKEKYWSPVDLYVGGAEHATRHLIYARFWHKFLFDIGAVSKTEPFKKLQSVGLIMGEDGRKMSKRFGNVVNPDDMVKTYGADTMRVYEMFMGPFDQQISWNTSSMIGARRFIERVWKMQGKIGSRSSEAVLRTLHKTIKKVTEDIADLRFNTAISSLMIAIQEFEKSENITKQQFESLLKILAPFAPHVTEELWARLGNKKSIHISGWPEYDPNAAKDELVKIIVQVSGKVRGSFEIARDSEQAILEETAKSLPEISRWIAGKKVSKVIVVPNRIVNIVLTQ